MKYYGGVKIDLTSGQAQLVEAVLNKALHDDTYKNEKNLIWSIIDEMKSIGNKVIN